MRESGRETIISKQKSKPSQMEMNNKIIIIARMMENKQWFVLKNEYSQVNFGWQITSLPANWKFFGRKFRFSSKRFVPAPIRDVMRINFDLAVS